ncbi:ABC transporter substrate-binding protein [Roseibium suaedae]|uniref:ABC-type Fe3+ transport system, substrate-binding protein n=1 Tax=Roseibium suaedae TaxID=735517 RepID=A0A1M7PRI9_9HYPH|nr:extracellular solute-binding protein [Roseibium suaedae]SHN20012.1 ABC-type Fe3+ transport system, substrate-binding protein [Roseibium suaedae]
MRKTFLRSVLAVGLMALPMSGALAQDADFKSWLETAKLSEFQPQEEDWNDIIAKAKAEGEVTVYSSSSGVNALAEDFQKLYPEIKVNAYDLGSEKTIEKVVREQQAGIYNVDVVNTGGAAQMIYDLLPKNLIVNYVPRYLVDVIPENLREPLLTQVVEATALMYNADSFPEGSPIKNVWQLTEPEWKSRFAMKSPLGSLTTLALLTSITEHADQFDKAYQDYAGKPLELSEGIENAGYEFLHRLLKNDLVIFKSGSKLATASGLKGQEKPLITFASMHYINKNASDDYANAIPYEIDPAAVFAYSTYTSIAGRAPHPNAAKLFVAFQMGSPDLNKDSKLEKPYREGESLKLLQGLGAYYKVGTFSPRTDVPLPKGAENWPEVSKIWGSPEFQRDNVAAMNDFWVYETSQ